MTIFSDVFEVALDVIIAVHGVSLTYTEAGGAAQAATGLAENFRVDRHQNATKEFTFRTDDLTVDAEDWRGAEITDTDALVYTIVEKSDSPERIKFTATRALERS